MKLGGRAPTLPGRRWARAAVPLVGCGGEGGRVPGTFYRYSGRRASFSFRQGKTNTPTFYPGLYDGVAVHVSVPPR